MSVTGGRGFAYGGGVGRLSRNQKSGRYVDSYKCLWAFIECFKRFLGLQSSLGITNVNRSHNKPLELIETI